MKIVWVILVVVVIGFIAVQAFGIYSQSGIEQYPYELVESYENFEVRVYESTLFTTVKLSTADYEKGSSQGFSILAGYIFGGNEKEEKIAMTSPVAMSMEDSMEMMFMVPKKYNKNDLPTPNNSKIQFKEMPAKKVAAISFGGWANQKKINEYKTSLVNSLQESNISHTGKFFFLGYNAPYEMFNRKNEVIVELN